MELWIVVQMSPVSRVQKLPLVLPRLGFVTPIHSLLPVVLMDVTVNAPIDNSKVYGCRYHIRKVLMIVLTVN